MDYSREDIIREVDSMLAELRANGVSEKEIDRRENILKSDEAMVCFEFLFNRFGAGKKGQTLEEIASTHSIDALNLSNHTYNPIMRCGRFRTVADLLALTEYDMRRIRHFGEHAIAELKEKLAQFKAEHLL